MPARFDLGETTLTLGFDNLYNYVLSFLFKDIVIPLDKIVQVNLQPEGAEHGFKGLRVGAEVFCMYLSGTIYHPLSGEKKEFYYMPSIDTSRVIGLTLRQHEYSRVFMETPPQLDPNQLVENIRNAIGQTRAHQD